jgi:hypothetical protein
MVYDEGGRDPPDPTVIENHLPGSQYNGVSDPVMPDKRPQNGASFLIERYPYDLKPFASESLVKPYKIRNLLEARTTPGGKEV